MPASALQSACSKCDRSERELRGSARGSAQSSSYSRQVYSLGGSAHKRVRGRTSFLTVVGRFRKGRSTSYHRPLVHCWLSRQKVLCVSEWMSVRENEPEKARARAERESRKVRDPVRNSSQRAESELGWAKRASCEVRLWRNYAPHLNCESCEGLAVWVAEQQTIRVRECQIEPCRCSSCFVSAMLYDNHT